ncbi:MAG TPA: FAD-dependent oxidoreductase [Xanthobacteraceae bacterium]|jgi:nitrite reductase (NADH) large subunit
MSEPLVIIGNGMAAARLADELACNALGRYAVAIIGEEPQLAYNRVLLSSLLADEVAPADIELKPARWWRDRGVTLRYGACATAVDVAARAVTLADGTRLAFSKAVFATGSRPIRLNVPGAELPGVMTFRDIGDVDAMRLRARKDARVVVIGGGLLGLEAAYGLAKAGARVALIHLMDRLMERQLDAVAAGMLRHAMERRGIDVLLEAETARIAGSRHVEAVELKDGRVLKADMVVMAVGIRPNTALAGSAGIAVNRGILVDDGLETSVSGLYAIGECAEHRGQCYGLVEPACAQAAILARRLAGQSAQYQGTVLATNLKVSGVDVFSAGDFLGATGTESIVLCDPGLGSYRKLVVAQDRLVGAVLYGDVTDALWYLDLIRSGVPIASFRDVMAFGRSVVDRAAA